MQALLERTRQRANVGRSSACETCFTRYCWNGTTDDGGIGPNGKPPRKGLFGGFFNEENTEDVQDVETEAAGVLDAQYPEWKGEDVIDWNEVERSRSTN